MFSKVLDQAICEKVYAHKQNNLLIKYFTIINLIIIEASGTIHSKRLDIAVTNCNLKFCRSFLKDNILTKSRARFRRNRKEVAS